jgi:hypothetical protein
VELIFQPDARLLASRRRILQEYCAWGVTVRRQRDHHAKEFTSSSARSYLYTDMSNSPEGQISPATANASVSRKPESNVAKSWFIPPIVVPAFLILLIVARAVYTAFS